MFTAFAENNSISDYCTKLVGTLSKKVNFDNVLSMLNLSFKVLDKTLQKYVKILQATTVQDYF